MSTNNTKRDITTNDDVTTFNVKCTNVAHAKRIIEMLHANDVETFVYRAQYDNERASHMRARDKMLRDITRAQMNAHNENDDARVREMQNDVRAYCIEHNIEL